MTKDIIVLDLFSGIGGFSLGLERAGFNIKTHYFSEIDKHAIAVYKHNFKNAIYAGSVTTVRGTDIERPNVITFGSPCQDFSLAGKRAGMEGERSSLILHAMRLIDECRPDFFIWENVKGAFSSNNGADFWAIIQAFANIGGYRLEWQLLNTSWVLPQNRERIYLVGHLAVPGRSFRPVFPIGESDCGANEPTNKYIKVRPVQIGHSAQEWSSIHGTNIGEFGQDAYTIRSSQPNGVMVELGNIKVRSATTQGYEEAAPGDSINYSVPNSATRRGRVGKGVAQTLDTQSNQAVVLTHYGHKDKDAKVTSISPTLKAESHGHEPMTFDGAKIRRLTEIECERLQGFPDNWNEYGDYDGVVNPVPKTQRYKQCGNAVTVDIVKLVAERLLKYTQ